MKNLKRLNPYIAQHKWRIGGGIICLAVASYLSLLVARIAGEATDAVQTGGHAARDFMMFAAEIVGYTVVLGIFRYLMREWIIGASRDIEMAFRNDLFAKLQSLPPSFFDRQRTGDLMAKATNDVEQVRSFVGPGFLQFFNSAMIFPLAIWRMWLIDPRLATLTMLPLISLPFIMNYFGNRIHWRFRQCQDQYSHISAMVQENLAGVRVVKAFVQEEAEKEKFAELNRQFISMNMALANVQSGFYPAMRVLTGLCVVILLYVGGHDVINQRITVGELVEFSLIQTMLFWPMIAFGWTVSLMQRGAASMDRIAEILELPSYVKPLDQDDMPDQLVPETEGSEEAGCIEMRKLTFRYAPSLPDVLHNVSIKLPAGQRLGIVGHTGSGKSTIAALLGGLYAPGPGQLFIDGRDIREIPLEELRDRISIVFQETFLFSDTIGNNIAFGKPDSSPEEIRRMADVAHISREIEELPAGYETVLGERGINLSGGQKQRTAIARALLRDSGIIVLDDALSAVDTETESRILQSLHQELQGRTSVIIAHRVSAVMNCEQIIVLENGRIIESGTHGQLMDMQGEYADLFERQLLADSLEEETQTTAAE
jgi:ATP-binding cassette subfamily B protein